MKWSHRFPVRAVLIAATLAGLGLFAVERYCTRQARYVARRAVERFGGDPAGALLAQVACETCGMRDRDRAVWALGQLEEADALPELERLWTGGICDHETRLCQYELGKAIKKIKGTWNLHASLHYNGTIDPR